MARNLITKAKIDEISAQLRQLPALPKAEISVNKKDAVQALRKDIEALQKKGYTLQKVSEILTGNGIDLSTSTLKSYLSKDKNKPIRKTTNPTHKSNHSITNETTDRQVGFTIQPDSVDL